jgi:glycosyltransferase involved in cell wall biosynthesis
MASSPLVSVVIPTHNRVSFLPLTLHSVLGQEGVTLEVVVVDDGSTEDVRDVVNRAGAGDARVRLLRHDVPLGVSAARNSGVAAAGGTWIAFVDDDDVWAPDKLVSQIREATRQETAWAYAGAVYVTADLSLIGGAPPPDPREAVARLPHINDIPGGCSGVVARRDLLPADPFDRSMGTCADWDLWIRLARQAVPACIARPLVGYRIHGSNMSLDVERLQAEFAEIESRYGGPIDWPTFHRYLGRISLRSGRRLRAVNYYARAARIDAAYRAGDLVPDLVEVARDAGDRLRDRIVRELKLPSSSAPIRARRGRAVSEWAEQARPWLEQLARFNSELRAGVRIP